LILDYTDLSIDIALVKDIEKTNGAVYEQKRFYH
jgi:hypothetical protein